MLVLSRKRNEGITIHHPSGPVHVVIVEVRGDKVRVGIDADRSMVVHRDEVLRAIEKEGPRKKGEEAV